MGRLVSNRATLTLLAGLLAAAIALTSHATGFLSQLEEETVDVRFRVRGEQPAPDRLVVVGIDPQTFSDLDERFPFPRTLHARVIDELREDGATQIVYDIQFTERSEPREDLALVDAVDRTDGIVLATAETNRDGSTNVLGGDAFLERLGARAGHSEFDVADDGTYRRYPFALDGLDSLPVAAIESRDGEEVDPGLFDGNGEAWIDYAGPPRTLETVSFSDVHDGRFEPGTFEGATVVVGATASTLQDVHPTPFGGGQMPGPEIQANAIATLGEGNPVEETPDGIAYALIVLAAALPPLLNVGFGAALAFGVAILAGVTLVGGAQLLFGGGLIVPIVNPLLALILGAVACLAINYLVESFQRQRTRDIFARFVPTSVVGSLLERGDGDPRLSAERTEATILFSDIRGFTTFSETRTPEEVVDVLNEYLDGMVEAILNHGGTLIAYLGDGILGAFGTPIAHADHADRALAAAQEMLGPRLERFNEWARERGLEGFEMGVGLNSGPVSAGMIGSDRRLDYTVIGDAVNTASRLEGMTKGSGYSLYLSDSTRDALSGEGPALVDVGELEVRGRAEALRVWAVKNSGGG